MARKGARVPAPTNPPIVVLGADGVIRSIHVPPIECAGCKSMHSFMVNRGGKTLCVMCDAKKGE